MYVQGRFPQPVWHILFVLVSQVILLVSLIDEIHPILLVVMTAGVLAYVPQTWSFSRARILSSSLWYPESMPSPQIGTEGLRLCQLK